MSTYYEHKKAEGLGAYLEYADKPGADIRHIAAASREARARYLATLRELDTGTITLYMSKHDLQRRLEAAKGERK